MAANTNPVFTLTPNCKSVANSGSASAGIRANPQTNPSAWTTTPVPVTIITGGTNGTRVEGVNFQATVTSVAGLIRVWHYVAATTSWFLLAEKVTAAASVSATVGGNTISWTPTVTPFVIAVSDLIAFTVEKAEVWQATGTAGDY